MQDVADVMFCNDRSTAEEAKTWSEADTILGFGTNTTTYGARMRMLTNSPAIPTFMCPLNNAVNVTNSSGQFNNDWFTADSTDANKGNGMLEYPVGLITMDEAAAAGAKKYISEDSNANNNYYLYKGDWYWSFSPRSLSSDGKALIFIINRTLGDASARSTGAISPVINLSSEYVSLLSGNGTMTDPYTLES